MKRISLPWGNVLIDADSPRQYELLLESMEESILRTCYLRLNFDPGEWTLTLKPRESAGCMSDYDGRPGPRQLVVIARLLRDGAAIQPRTGVSIGKESVVRLASWGRFKRSE